MVHVRVLLVTVVTAMHASLVTSTLLASAARVELTALRLHWVTLLPVSVTLVTLVRPVVSVLLATL